MAALFLASGVAAWVWLAGHDTPAPVSQPVASAVPAPLPAPSPAVTPPILGPQPVIAAQQPVRNVQNKASSPAQLGKLAGQTSKATAKSAELKTLPPQTPTTYVPQPSAPNHGAARVPVVIGSGTDSESLRMESTLMRPPKSSKVTIQADTERSAALEALAQAQSLWNSGSHAAAIELLRQALARVENSAPANSPVTGQSALASLARELARMELADGQVSQALTVLTRLEPQLSQLADVWAMRGNAAQRLGRHTEAAQSYQKALTFKPDEPRWMLGAAVSLAAQGQTAAAAELADKARSMGALRPEVASYLRQLGVTMRAD
jgi:Flp pilus assembly protein TadD